MQTQKKTRLAAWLGSALALMLSLGMTAAAASEQALKASLAEQKASDAGSAKSQQRIAQLADQTSELIGEYRLALQKLDRVKIYNINWPKANLGIKDEWLQCVNHDPTVWVLRKERKG